MYREPFVVPSEDMKETFRFQQTKDNTKNIIEGRIMVNRAIRFFILRFPFPTASFSLLIFQLILCRFCVDFLLSSIVVASESGAF